MPKIESLKNYIDELISEVEKELDESTSTGDIAGYETPNAFSDGSDATKRRKKKIATQLGMQLVGKVESVSENIITEKQFKGLDGIPTNKSLEKITNTEKLNIIKGRGNIISFHVPAEFKSKRNFWQVISSGKINKNSTNGSVQLVGNGPMSSPIFKTIDDLINGVNWKSMEETRRFNESVSEATTSFVSGNSGRTITHLDNKKYQLTKDVKGAQIGNYHSVVLPKGSIIHNLPGGVFVSHPSLKDKFSGIKETPKFGFRVTTNSDTLITIEKSSKILESVNESGYSSDDLKVGSVIQGQRQFSKLKGIQNGMYYKVVDIDSISVTIVPSDKNGRIKGSKKVRYAIYDIEAGIRNAIRGDGSGIAIIKESVNENRWLELKNDESMHANKKLAVGLRELKNQLKEVETFFRWYNQIKTMNELDSNQYWKRTNSHIYKIKERIINIARTLKEIEQ